jgi:hypothetical protein
VGVFVRVGLGVIVRVGILVGVFDDIGAVDVEVFVVISLLGDGVIWRLLSFSVFGEDVRSAGIVTEFVVQATP